jgi:hypothetical protein
MIFDFLAKGKVMVTMVVSIKNIIRDFPEEITGPKLPLPQTTYSL